MDDVNLTLDRGLFVILHILIFLLVLLVTESDHGTKEDSKRLLRNIFLFEVLSEDFSATLSHLILVFSVVDFKNFKTLARLGVVLDCLPFEFSLFQDFLDFGVCFGSSVFSNMEQIETDGATMSVLPDEFKAEVKQLVFEILIYDRNVIEDHFDGVFTHDFC